MSINGEKNDQHQNDPSQIESELAISPGRILREAREQQGITQQQVAEHLNLRLTLIKEIEKDHFPKHVASTFIRGYLRSYAKLLSIDASTVLEAHHPFENGKTGGMQSFSQRTRREASDSRLKWITYLVIAILLVLLVVWWWQESLQKSQIDPVVANSTVSSMPVTDHAIVTDTLESVVSAAQEDSKKPESTVAINPVVEASSTEVKQVSGPKSKSALTDGVKSLEATALRLDFRGECWVKVTDGAGKQLLMGIFHDGDNKVTQGQPPYHIILGAPQVVSLSYGGEAIDLSVFRNRIAKLVVPKQKVNNG